MRKGRFTEEPMVALRPEADRTSVAETAKKHKVSEQTICASGKHDITRGYQRNRLNLRGASAGCDW